MPLAPAPLRFAAAASAGAGVIHVAAAGAEHDRASVALVLVALGLAQLAWAGWAGTRRASTPLLAAGATISLVALVGWLVAVTSGLPFPDALSRPRSPAVPDVIAAALAVAVLATLARRALSGSSTADPGAAGDPAGAATLPAVALGAVVVLVLGAVVALPAAHDAQRRDDLAAEAQEAEQQAAIGGGAVEGEPAGEAARVAPFDPARPIDLSGLPTVSAAEQRAAEDLVADVLAERERYPSAEEAEALGYRTIGDAFTGEEHLIDWAAVLDPATLDPARPEALVYDVADDGSRTLAAVMFVRPPGTRIDDAPRPGSDLTTWHLHGEICTDPATSPPTAAGTTDAAGACPAGLDEAQPSPTLHVWVVRHPCGPFSELEGVGTDPSAVSGGCEHRHG